MKSKKIDKQDLKQIQTLQSSFSEFIQTLGLLQIDEKSLSNQLNMVEENKNQIFLKIDEIKKEEETFLKSLQDKYGDGQINLEAGTFTPNN